MALAHTRAYRGSTLLEEGFEVAKVSDYLAEDDVLVWVDFCAPEKDQLDELADELGLHELAVEDALSPHQRPKVDYYESHAFLSCHAVTVNPDTGELDKTEINAFVNERWLITVRKHERFPIEPIMQRWDRSPNLVAEGVGFLLYAVLDVVIDGYFDTSEMFDEFYDQVSEGLFSDTPLDPAQQRHWFQMRRSLVHFHRLVVPMREAVSGLMRRENDVVSARLYPYFQDIYDHILRVSETTDALRDLVATIVETNLSLRDFRQNQVMKKVTSWAAIVAVPTLITGFYGMNVPYPGSGEDWGTATAVTLVVVLSALLYLLFRRRDWL
jgi:magnesium transporter